MSHTKTILSIYTFISLLLLAIFVYGIFDIRTKGQMASTFTNEADQASNNDTLAQSIQFMKTNSKDTLLSLDQFILTEDKLVPFMELIESTGKSMGLATKIVSVSVDKQDPKNLVSYDVVHMVVETDGAWSPSVTFLHALENLPSSIAIDESNLVLGTGSGTTNVSQKNWNMSTTITISSFK